MWWSRKREERELADAREEALRWYERLGGQVANLPPGDSAATKQALVDAGERYNAAGAQLDRATSVTQFQLARESALEGLAYVRAARVSLGFDPGPPLPPLASQRGAGAIRQEREVTVGDRNYRASPRPADTTPYYYPGGQVSGRPVPAGWYSEPWWKTALVAGAWGIGGALVFDALLAPSWGDYGGYGQGYDQGFAAGDNQGYDQGFDQGQQQGYDEAQQQDQQQYDQQQDQGGYDQPADESGSYDQGGVDQGSYDQGSYDDGGGGFDGGGFDGGGFDGGGGFDF
jgi:uncharacterized membrane protein YgcG